MADDPKGAGTGTTDPAALAAAAATKATADAKVITDAAAAKAVADAAGAGDVTKGGKAGEVPPQPKAPEKYALTIPTEGGHFADKAFLAELETIARASNWTNEDAQNALVEHVTLSAAKAAGYLAVTTADPEFGGAQLAESQRLANRVIDRIRPPGHARRDGFLGFLAAAGANNAIDVVSFLADIGKAMGEDSPPRGRQGSVAAGDLATRMYDHPSSRALDEQTKA